MKSKLPPIQQRLPKNYVVPMTTSIADSPRPRGAHDNLPLQKLSASENRKLVPVVPVHMRKAGDFRRRKPGAVQLAPLEPKIVVPDSAALEVAGLHVSLVRSECQQPVMPEAARKSNLNEKTLNAKTENSSSY